MNNKRVKDENKSLKSAAEHLLLDKELSLKGKDQLEKAMHNIKILEEKVESQIDIKRDLLQELRQRRINQTTQHDEKRLQHKIISAKRYLQQEPELIENEKIGVIDIDREDFMSSNYTYTFAEENHINLENPFFNLYSQTERIEFSHKVIEQFDLLRLDADDYGFAVSAAIIAGIVDILFVGTIKSGKDATGLQKAVDDGYGSIVKKFSKMQQIADLKENLKRTKNIESQIKLKKQIEYIKQKNGTLSDAIKYLEKKHRVSYDAPLHESISGMKINNHHNSSLAHDFSLLGLLFGIIDQLTGKSSFIDPDSGMFLRVQTGNKNNELGDNLIERIVEATKNWFGHCMSDISGSSTSKGRGMGLPAPFWPYLQKLNFGQIKINDKKDPMTIGQFSTWIYEQGYDFRAFTTELIPVIIFETLIRCYWFYKQYYYFGKSLPESLEMFKKREIDRLLLVATSSFTSIDTTHAIIKSHVKGGCIDIGTFALTVNKPGLLDFGFRSVQNIRNEINQRKHVQLVLETDILIEYKRVIKANSVFE